MTGSILVGDDDLPIVGTLADLLSGHG